MLLSRMQQAQICTWAPGQCRGSTSAVFWVTSEPARLQAGMAVAKPARSHSQLEQDSFVDGQRVVKPVSAMEERESVAKLQPLSLDGWQARACLAFGLTKQEGDFYGAHNSGCITRSAWHGSLERTMTELKVQLRCKGNESKLRSVKLNWAQSPSSFSDARRGETTLSA